MILENISKLDVYVGLAISGLFTGLGAALGAYLANNQIVKRTVHCCVEWT